MLKLLLIISLIVISGCSVERNLDESIRDGLQYLDYSYNNFKYDDPYLEFIYPSEELNCEISGCDLTYRILDAYFNVYFLHVFRGKFGQFPTSYLSSSTKWHDKSYYRSICSQGN